MNSKKRFFQENNSGGDQSKKQRNKFSDWKKYSAKDKSRWPELQQMISIKLNSNEIGYLLDPSAIAEIKADPAKPTYEHFKPSTAKPTETNEEKEARDLTNDVLKSMYKEALSTKTRERKDMQRHFEKYLAILFEDLVDKTIRDELHDFMTSDCQGLNAEDRCNAVLKHQSRCPAADQQHLRIKARLHGMVQVPDGVQPPRYDFGIDEAARPRVWYSASRRTPRTEAYQPRAINGRSSPRPGYPRGSLQRHKGGA